MPSCWRRLFWGEGEDQREVKAKPIEWPKPQGPKVRISVFHNDTKDKLLREVLDDYGNAHTVSVAPGETLVGDIAEAQRRAQFGPPRRWGGIW